MKPPAPGHALRLYLGMGLILSLLGMVGLWYALGAVNTVVVWLVSWLIAVNLVTFALFGFDKRQARRGGGRVPEVVLHGMSLIGGSPGAALAMAFFRHKTIKGAFRILFACIVLLQAAGLLWLTKVLWWS